MCVKLYIICVASWLARSSAKKLWLIGNQQDLVGNNQENRSFLRKQNERANIQETILINSNKGFLLIQNHALFSY